MKVRYLFRALKARYRDQKLEIGLALALIRRGDLVADVGANKGAYVYWLRKAVGREGAVLAFEPQPRLASYLESIRIRMGWKNVEIQRIALSDEAGFQTLHVPGGGISPGASLESSVLSETEGETFECRVERLDDQLRGRKRVTFLKIDVEGHELSVFRGGIETIRRDAPVILFECERRHLTRHGMGEVFDYLKSLGYTGFFLTKRMLRPLGEFDSAVHQKQETARFWDAPDYFNNFLFLCPDAFDLESLRPFRTGPS